MGLLTNCDLSSLVIDKLCDEAIELDNAVTCFTSTSLRGRNSHSSTC